MNPSRESQDQSLPTGEFDNYQGVVVMNQGNTDLEASSKENYSSKTQDLHSEDSKLEVIGNSCASTSRTGCEDTFSLAESTEETSSLNRFISRDNSKECEVMSPELREQEVTNLNITGRERKSEATLSENCTQVVVKKESESLRRLMTYEGASDSDDSEEDSSNKDPDVSNAVNNKINSENSWRNGEEDLSDSSDSESDSAGSTLSSESDSDSDNSDRVFNNSDGESVKDASSDDGIINETRVLTPVHDRGAVKKANKAFLAEEKFPPIPDLSKININADEEFMHIGKVIAIIGTLVTVESLPGMPAFDLDSMLFISDDIYKKPLGPIYDVLGPVSEPIYCVRFNNEDEIKSRGVLAGLKVFAAPKSDEFSKFVFVKELLKMKGTDASWLNDQEQPVDMLDLSDDEEHQTNRTGNAREKRKLIDNSVERHRRYERTMNQCNALNTKVCKLMDAHKNISKHIRPNARVANQPQVAPAPAPEFNPTVPPPGFGQPSPFGYIGQARPVATSHPAFAQPPSLIGPYFASNYGAPVMFSSQSQFGNFYPGISSPAFMDQSPQWPHYENFLRLQFNQRPENLPNQDNYFTNNSRNSNGQGPGPSSQSP